MIRLRAFLLAVSCSQVFAVGSISGVSGTLTQGGAVTVSGSGFTTKNSTQVLFDNFSDGTTGDAISARGVWEAYSSSNVIEYAISTANAYIGSKNARATVGLNFNPLGADDFGDHYVWPSGTKEIYMESAFYLNETSSGIDPPDPNQIKLFRMTVVTDATSAPDPWQGLNRSSAANSTDYQTTQAIMQSETGGTGGFQAAPYETVGYVKTAADSPFVDYLAPLTWHQFAMYSKLSSTQGAADGMRFANIDGNATQMLNSNWPSGGYYSDPLNAGATNRAWNGAAIVTWGTGAASTDIYHYLHLPFFKRDTMAYVVDIGYVYINDSPERVVIHNASTLAASTHYQVQKQTSRGASSIAIEYQAGNLTGGDAKYVTVVNSDNTFSTSFLYTGGAAPSTINGRRPMAPRIGVRVAQ